MLAFSDAVFAIAITLLTLNLEVRPDLHGADFTKALHQVLPALGAYVLSFVILGQLWLAHHRIFGVIARVDYTVLVRNLVFLGLIAIMPFPVRLLSDYTRRPLAVAIYAVAFITAMQLQRLIWLDVTRRERRDLLTEPVPDQVRTGFGRVLLGLLVVFGAAVPVGMFAPRYATLAWAVIIPAAAGRGPAHQLAILAAQRDLAVSQALERDNAKLRMERDLLKEPRPSGSRRRRHRDALPLRRCQKAAGFPSLSSCAGEVGA